MPSTEFVQSKTSKHSNSSFPKHLRIFILYVCPVCLRYTVHAPRSDRKGDYFVDHKRVPVHQLALDGSKEFVGLAAADACFVKDCRAVINIETTRTVIRVK
jgi:hypothetical protein